MTAFPPGFLLSLLLNQCPLRLILLNLLIKYWSYSGPSFRLLLSIYILCKNDTTLMELNYLLPIIQYFTNFYFQDEPCSKHQTKIPGCLLDIFTGISQEHFQFRTSRVKLLIFSQPFLTYQWHHDSSCSSSHAPMSVLNGSPSLFILWDVLCLVLSQVRLFPTPWTVAHQAPLSLRFSRQEYWSGLPYPSPGDLPNPGIKPTSPTIPALAGGSIPLAPPRKP